MTMGTRYYILRSRVSVRRSTPAKEQRENPGTEALNDKPESPCRCRFPTGRRSSSPRQSRRYRRGSNHRRAQRESSLNYCSSTLLHCQPYRPYRNHTDQNCQQKWCQTDELNLGNWPYHCLYSYRNHRGKCHHSPRRSAIALPWEGNSRNSWQTPWPHTSSHRSRDGCQSHYQH